MKRSTFKVLFYIKRGNPKRNGNVVIMGRISINGKRSQFSTKLEIHPTLWDTESNIAKGNEINAYEINLILDKIRKRIFTIYNDLIYTKGFVTPEEIKQNLFGIQEQDKTIMHYFNEFNEYYKSKVGIMVIKTTYQRYELAKNRLSEFLKERYNVDDKPYREITTVFIQNFYLFLRKKYRCGNNNAMKTIQHLKAIFNHIKNSGESFADPFANFKMNFEKVERTYLTKDELHILYSKELDSERLDRVRDLFLFCCYTGICYSDLRDLTLNKVQKGIDGNLWIIDTRNKTKVEYKVRLLKIPVTIIKKYESLQNNGKLLPVISNQKINDYLSEITKFCDINKKITTMVARHTFATLCLSEGIPIETVSKLLGHTKIKTTQIYAKIIDQKLSSDMEILAMRLDNL